MPADGAMDSIKGAPTTEPGQRAPAPRVGVGRLLPIGCGRFLDREREFHRKSSAEGAAERSGTLFARLSRLSRRTNGRTPMTDLAKRLSNSWAASITVHQEMAAPVSAP